MATDITLVTVGLSVLVLGLLSGVLRKSMLSESLAALIAGIILGPAVLGVLEVGDLRDPVIEEVTRFTLAIGLMGVALRLPPRQPSRQARSLAVVVILVMPVMCLVTAVFVHLFLGLPWWISFLIGAVLAPTDPVIVSTVVTSQLAERHVPSRIRNLLSAESGFNDGLGVPLVLLPLFLVTVPSLGEVGLWLLQVFGFEILGGAALGVLGGLAAGWILKWVDRHNAIEKSSLLAYALALSLLLLGLGSLAGVEPLLSVFIGGLAFDRVVTNQERKAEANVQEAVHRFFSIPIFLLLGTALPWAAWFEMGWSALGLALTIILFRRLPVLIFAGRLMPDLQGTKDRLFVGWFGPMGVGSIYLAGLAYRKSGYEEVLAVAVLLVAVSVLVHSVTAAPWARRFNTGQSLAPASR